jgi:hypothetical protein
MGLDLEKSDPFPAVVERFRDHPLSRSSNESDKK